jgi:succinoglycan biosynthesis transport protein ExoP
MELKHYLSILRRWGWIMVLCTVLAGIASYWFSSQQPRVYEGVSQYLVGPVLDNPNVKETDLRASGAVGQTYVALATTRPLLQSVIDKLKLKDPYGQPLDPSILAPNVTATWLDATQVLTIRARAADPAIAANISNTIGDTLIERSPGGAKSLQVQRQQEALTQIAKLQENSRSVQAEIDQLATQVQQTNDQVVQRALIVRLDERRAELAATQRALTDQYTIVQSSSTNQIDVLQSAVPNPIPIAPEIVRNVLAALIAGLVLGLAAMLLFEYFTDVIYTPEELRKATGLPYLGGIARHKRLRGNDISQIVVHARPETLAVESYRMLRTNLQVAGTDLHLPSLLITSPSRGDGKSDIAANLAVSLARAGKQVILVDANLRRPRLATLFGLSDDQGLSYLLDAPGQRLEPQPISAIPGLSVLPAGPVALNSSEILGSQRMYRLIQEFKAQADVVILDSPPLLYSDALVLAPQVDGVLLVANSATTGRENTINAVESLRLVGAHLIGTVLNRVKAGPAYSYYPAHVAKRPALALAAPAATPPALAAPSIVGENRERITQVLTTTPDASQQADTIEDRASAPAPVAPPEVVAEPVAPATALLTELPKPIDPPVATVGPADQTTEESDVMAAEMKTEVGALVVEYEQAEEVDKDTEIAEMTAPPTLANSNGHRSAQGEGDRTRQPRRNRSRG